jgi:uncharacterized Tic20 family protein
MDAENVTTQPHQGETPVTTNTADLTTQASPTSDQRSLAALSHISAFVMFLGIPAVIGPLVAWLLKRDDEFVGYHAREALNFNISFMIYGIAAAISIILLVGLILLPVVLVTWFILVIVASIKASAGEYYEYPLTIRFVS